MAFQVLLTWFHSDAGGAGAALAQPAAAQVSHSFGQLLTVFSVFARNTETRVALVQRSCGYADRPTLSIAEIQRVVRLVREASPRCLVLVDNCYGEFTEPAEPCAVGLLPHSCRNRTSLPVAFGKE